MIIVNYKKIFFALSAGIVAFSIGAIAMFGLQFGLDFTGGSLVEFIYSAQRPSQETVSQSLSAADINGFSLREAGENGFALRAGNLTDAQRSSLTNVLSINGAYPMEITRANEIGPTIGTELRNKSYIALGAVLLTILLFIAFAFRKVSEPVSSWVYGTIALVTLVFDVIVPVGFFSVLGYFHGAQIDTLFVTAILTILGFSIHDTIVVFDRVRENLRTNQEKNRHEEFASVAGRSLNQTFVRSVNTSFTTLLSLLALYFVGPESTKDFALVLLVGIAAGTYSSIALATPLLVWWEGRKK